MSETIDLSARAERAAQILKRVGHPHFVGALKRSVYIDPNAALPAVTELNKLRWPLVITTNYDSLFIDNYNIKNMVHPLSGYYTMEVVGRGRGDCQRVLNSRHVPDRPLLWAIQGFFDAAAAPVVHPLSDQLAVGHVDYRRQAHRAIFFRRAFAEIYRSQTLPFLGSGMSESYFHDLFDEIIELHGNCSHFHHALVKRGQIKDPKSFERRFQVRIYEWDEPDEVVKALESLDAAIKQTLRPKASSWSYWVRATGASAAPDFVPDIEVERTGLPAEESVLHTEAIILSAGADGVFGRPGRNWSAAAGYDEQSFRTYKRRLQTVPLNRRMRLP